MDQTLFLESSRAARTLYKLSSLFIILLLALLFGCANHAARNEELLAIDYQNLSNDELSLYYYDLQDQIDIVERRSSAPRLSLGLGLSSFGGSSSAGGGVGVSTDARGNPVAGDLRERKNLVKLEMQKRGLEP